jgi:uncharacterized MAPEG superfamily protein
MTTELTMLALSVVLGIVQIVLSAQTKNLPTGYLWAAGPRDEPRPPLTAMAGWLERALSNFLETFPLFAAAVLIAHTTGRHDWMTVWGAQLYFWGRLAYLPLYALGVFLVRSLAWNLAHPHTAVAGDLRLSLRSWRSRRRSALWRGCGSEGATGSREDRLRWH